MADSVKMKGAGTVIGLVMIVAVAVALRCCGLLQQKIIFFDEGQILRRAMDLCVCREGLAGEVPDSLYIDTKIFWISGIALGRTFLKTSILTGKLFSFLAGLGTVLVVYGLAWDRYRCRRLAFCSAAVLAVSSAHVFYSRLILPDAAAAFLALLSFYLYGKDGHGRSVWRWISGMVLGCAVLTHYRIAVFLVFFILAEAQEVWRGRSSWPAAAARLGMLVAAAVLTGLIFEIILVSVTGMYFFENLVAVVRSYSQGVFDPSAFWLYPYYVYQYDGAWLLFLLAVSLLFIGGTYSSGLFVVFLLSYLIVAAFSPFQYARLIVPVLPVIAILAGVALENVLLKLRRTGLIVCFCALTVMWLTLGAYQTYRDVRGWKANINDAAVWVKDHRQEDRVLLTTNSAILSGYLPGRAYYLLQEQKAGSLPHYFDKGVSLLIIDPHKFAVGGYGPVNKGPGMLLINEVEGHCQPIVSFPAFSTSLFRRFMNEHVKPSLPEVLKGGKFSEEGQANRIDIYDVPACLQSLAADKSPLR